MMSRIVGATSQSRLSHRMEPNMDMLQTRNDLIVDAKGNPVRLRGFGVGGWMNTENFINGYPGFESGLRRSLAETIGPTRAEFLFDRMLDYFLAEDDIAEMKKLGATVVRLPLNYRHFETDLEPLEYMEKGFARLDRVLGWCAKHGLYAILDLHAVQGWQDPDWHSDHFGRLTLFWHHRHFQDRFIALWEEFARRYKGNSVIAGYNVINEPVTGVPYGFFGYQYKSDWDVLNTVYRRVVAAIRKIDPDHIIFLEGDLFSVLFAGLEPPFADNLVYSSHNYIRPCLEAGAYPGRFSNGSWDAERMNKDFAEQEGTQFCRKHNAPLWVGEFGGAFDGPAGDVPHRLRATDDQIQVFEANRSHWTIWTWKDVGMMGMMVVDPGSDYLKTVAPVQAAKRALATDCWILNQPKTAAQVKVAELGDLILKSLPETGADPERFKFYLEQTSLGNYLGTFIQPLWAKCFAGMTENDIDRVMQSFALKNCRVNQGLKGILQKYMSA
jgi:endoglucanase